MIFLDIQDKASDTMSNCQMETGGAAALHHLEVQRLFISGQQTTKTGEGEGGDAPGTCVTAAFVSRCAAALAQCVAYP